MGSLYMGVLLIEGFGVFSAVKVHAVARLLLDVDCTHELIPNTATHIASQDIQLCRHAGSPCRHGRRDDAHRCPFQIQGKFVRFPVDILEAHHGSLYQHTIINNCIQVVTTNSVLCVRIAFSLVAHLLSLSPI